ncbi:DUF89 domain-containing protein [Coprinopsis sp. MPI-PUGE-AT-0042]|nr:DUF89 domain-containing protein [Coprinopsis sp. MPI-PUGE-AT-0042]
MASDGYLAAPSTSAPSQSVPKVTLHLGHLPQKSTNLQASWTPWLRSPNRIDPNNPPWPAYRGYHEYSFAHATMQSRLPTILGKAIEDANRTLNSQSSEDRVVDLCECIKRMQILMDDLSGNAKLRPIIDDGEADVALWNKEIAKYFQGKDFMNAPWLFAEAYKYRRLHECFSVSKFWKDYDVFYRQKNDTFSRSTEAVFELSLRFAEPFKHLENSTPEQRLEAERLMFLELTQEQIRSLQSTGGEHLASTERNILGNHMKHLWEVVKDAQEKGTGRIDFVLDNAGFELYCDCVYADFLIQSGLATEIHFHGKRYPWFVSDVTSRDWAWLLNTMVYGNLFPNASEVEMASLRSLGQRWKQYEKEGKWIYEQHPFWCTGYTFWDLHSEAPDLFLHLSKQLAQWPSQPGAPRVASLRTIKSDVVVGLGADGDETARKLDEAEPGWKISGKYAVVLLSEGRPGEKVIFA